MYRFMKIMILVLVILSIITVPALAGNKLGNLSGNLRYDSFAVCSGSWIYYSAWGGIWKMQMDGTNKRQISSQFGYNINAIGNWVYFVGINHKDIYRIDTDGNNEQLLLDVYLKGDTSLYAYGDWLYFLDGTTETLYQLSQDGTKKEKIGDKSCNDFIIDDSGILYVSWQTAIGDSNANAVCCSYSLPNLEPLDTFDFFPEFGDSTWLYFYANNGYSRFSKSNQSIEMLKSIDINPQVMGDSYYFRDYRGQVSGIGNPIPVGYIFSYNPKWGTETVVSSYCNSFSLVLNWLFYFAFDESTQKMHHFSLQLSSMTTEKLD